MDPGETHLRAGLNLRDYDLDIVNRFNDRLYFANVVGNDRLPPRSGSGSACVCSGIPRRRPFGYIPPEGLKETPPAARRGREPKIEPALPARRTTRLLAGEDEASPQPRRRSQGTGRRPQVTDEFATASPLTHDLSLDLSEGGLQASVRGLSLARAFTSGRSRSRNHERDDRPDSPGLVQRLRQARTDRAGASTGWQSAPSFWPAAAPGRPWSPPVSRSPRSPTTPASPRFSAAGSRRCTPRSTAGSWLVAT